MLPSRKAFVRTSSASELNSAARLMLAIIVSDSDAHPPSRCAKSSARSRHHSGPTAERTNARGKRRRLFRLRKRPANAQFQQFF